MFADQARPTPIKAESSTTVKLKQVELTEQGKLKGQFLNAAGLPVGGVPVSVTVQKSEFKVKTDERGHFSIKCQSGGTAVIRIGKEVFACQIWLHGTAPPKAIKSIAIVAATEDIVMGNMADCARPARHLHHINPVQHLQHIRPTRLLALGGRQLVTLGLIAGGAVAIGVSANNDDAS